MTFALLTADVRVSCRRTIRPADGQCATMMRPQEGRPEALLATSPEVDVVSWVSAVLPIATLILGYFGTLLTEARRDERALSKSREERQSAADMKREEARDAFELDSLRRVHTSLSDFARAASRHHIADTLAAKAVGEYGFGQVGDDLSETLRLTTVALREASQLVLDDDIRAAVLNTLRRFGAVSLYRGSLDEAELLFTSAVQALEVAQDKVAAGIRAIYSPIAKQP